MSLCTQGKRCSTNAQVQDQRTGAPIFDVIVEVERGEACAWSIVRNAGLAVDAILDGKPYEVERRTCLPQENTYVQREVELELLKYFGVWYLS